MASNSQIDPTPEAPRGIHFHSDASLAIRCPFCGVRAGELCLASSTNAGGLAASMYGIEDGHSIYAHTSRNEAANG